MEAITDIGHITATARHDNCSRNSRVDVQPEDNNGCSVVALERPAELARRSATVRRTVVVGLSRDGIGGSVIVGLDLAAAIAGDAWSPIIACNADNPPLKLAQSRSLDAVSLASVSNISYLPNPRDGNFLKRIGKRIFLLRACKRFLKSHKPDLIHVHDESSALAWGIAARPYGIPVIWHVHQQLPQKSIDWLLLRLSRFVIFVSDANRVRFTGMAIPPSETVYNGVDLQRYRPSDRPADTGPVTIGFISNLVERKRPDWVLRAVGVLLRSGIDVRLVIAGNDFTGGKAAAELQALAEREGIAGRYSYMGFQSDVPGLLRGIDILALPSERDREAFPRIVVEALATGVPVVATCVAGIPEAVIDKYNGRLTDPDDFQEFCDAVRELCVDRRERERYGTNAREYAERVFSAAASSERLRRIYGTIANQTA